MAEWVLAIAGWDQGGHEDEMKNLAGELGLAWTDVRDQKSDNGGESRKQKTESKNEFHHSTFRNLAFSLLFLGPQFNEAKAACYHFCDAFILPSFSEGLPMAVLEAWANSKPVVMTPQCNLPQGFSAGAALVINPNTESIAEGLNEFLRMTETERVAMGSRGRALAADQFSWPRIAAQMQEAYEWMLGDGPRPACMADF
jgi:poly(glycerol-phosphate) alpha-glucosyltransferase